MGIHINRNLLLISVAEFWTDYRPEIDCSD